MNKIKSVLFVAGISLALAFTFGCSSGDDGDNSGGGSGSINVNPQIYIDNSYIDDDDVYHYKIEAYKGSGDIKIWAEYTTDKDTLINAGSVTNGIVNLKLPTIPNDEYLRRSSDFFTGGGSPYCTSYPESVKLWRGKFHLYDNNGKELHLMLSNLYSETYEYDDDFESTYAEIRYMYFQENVKITCNIEWGADVDPKLVNIDAKKGWNVIYHTETYGSKETKPEWSTNSNILKKEKEIKWIIDPITGL